MATIIRIKRSTGTIAPSSLKTAEMAYTYGVGTTGNFGDRLFIGTGDDGSENATSITVIGGSYFTDMLDHVQGTLTANSGVIVDSDKKIDQLLSGDIIIDGATNTITTPGKILYSNVYPTLADLPSASTYHGMFAHVHATGKGYFAHAGNWVPLANNDDLDSVTGVLRSDLDSATAVLRSDLDSATAELRSDLDSAVGTIAPTFSFTGDAGSDTVTLADSSLRFQGIPGQMLAVVTDNRVQLGLQATNVTPGNYGSTTKIPTIEVDHYGRIDSIGEASIELTSGLGMQVTTTATGTNIAQTQSPLYSTLTSNGVINSGSMSIPKLTIDATGRIQDVQLIGVQQQIGLIDSLGSNPYGSTFTAGGVGAIDRTIGVIGEFGIKSELQITNGVTNNPGRMAWHLSVDSAQLTGAVSGIAGGSWSADSNAIVLNTTDSNQFKIIIDDNISSPLDATDSTHLVNKRQFDSGLALVQLDSATWDNTINTLNITLGGDLTQVKIDNFGDSVNFADSVTFNNDIQLVNNKQMHFGNIGQGFIGRETTDNWLWVSNRNDTLGLSGASINLYSNATNDASKAIAVRGHLVPIYSPTTTFNIGRASGTTFNTVYADSFERVGIDVNGTYGSASAIPVFTLNKSGLIDSIGTVPVAGVDSASWDSSTNTLNITTGDGTIHDVEIDRFGDPAGMSDSNMFYFGAPTVFNISHMPNDGTYENLWGARAVSGQPFNHISTNTSADKTWYYRNSSGYYRRQLQASHVRVKLYYDNFEMLRTEADGLEIQGRALKPYGTGIHLRDVDLGDSVSAFIKTYTRGLKVFDSASIDEIYISDGTITHKGASNNIIIDLQRPLDSDSDGVGTLTVKGDILPGTDSAYDLGSSTKRWNSLYVKAIDRDTTTDSGVYGSQTQIPVLTINSSGFVDSAGTVPLATTLNINADAGTGDVALLDSSIEVAGGFNVNTRVVDNTVTVHLDSDVLGLTSLTVDNVKIDGNTISSTDSSNTLFIDPFPVGDSGDLVVRGNLIVQGTQTTVNSSIVSLNDKNLVLADSAVSAAIADGAGLTVGGDQFDSTATKPQFVFDAATYRWDPNLPIDIPFVSLDSAVFLNGVALREVMEDHLDNFFGVDSNNALTITYDDVQNSMTWKAINATKSQVGVSSFDSANFTVTAGHVAVSVLDGGTY